MTLSTYPESIDWNSFLETLDTSWFFLHVSMKKKERKSYVKHVPESLLPSVVLRLFLPSIDNCCWLSIPVKGFPSRCGNLCVSFKHHRSLNCKRILEIFAFSIFLNFLVLSKIKTKTEIWFCANIFGNEDVLLRIECMMFQNTTYTWQPKIIAAAVVAQASRTTLISRLSSHVLSIYTVW